MGMRVNLVIEENLMSSLLAMRVWYKLFRFFFFSFFKATMVQA